MTVDKLKVLIAPVIAVVVCGGGVVALWLWPAPKVKEDSRLLMVAVEKAGRRHRKALSLMTNTTFRVVQGGAASSPENVELREPGELDESAPGILSAAEAELRKKMVEHGQAEDEVMAMAHVTAARIASLRAKHAGEVAELAWHKARSACREGYAQQATLGSQIGQLRHYLNLTELSTAEVAQERGAATTEKAARQKDIQDLDTKVKGLEKVRDQRNAENQKRAAAAQKLETASQLAGDPKVKKDKWEESRTIRKEMDVARNKIESNEDDIAVEGARRKDLVVRLDTAKARIAAATVVLEDRATEKSGFQDAAQKLKDKVKKTQEQIEKLAATIVKTSKTGVQARTEAVSACTQAADDLTKAAELHSREKEAVAKAAHADVAMFWGRLLANQHHSSTETGMLVTDLQKIWADVSSPGAGKAEVPQVVKNIQNVVSQPGQIKAEAVAKYELAIQLYEEAKNAAPATHLQWAYEGQLALAHRALYHLSGNTTNLAEGRSALKRAVEGKESSPFLKQYVDELDQWPK